MLRNFKRSSSKNSFRAPILHFGFIILFTALLTYLSRGHNFVIFETKGLIAEKEKTLIIRASALIATIIIPVYIITVLFAWRYRERAPHEKTKAQYSPEWENAPYDELIWWAVPIEIILVLGMMTYHSTHDLDPYKLIENDSGKPPLTIEVVSLDWKWLFIYPEQHIVTVNLLEIPEGRPIDLKITADAPMNSFWIPELAGQIYAMPGMTTRLHLRADRQGDFIGRAANFSGAGFSDMTFTARSVSENDFDSWVTSTQSSAATFGHNDYDKLAEQSVATDTKIYTGQTTGLFDRILSHSR